ncbi:MAG: hypothetical protein QM715_11635 [Nibricoccus sp.]
MSLLRITSLALLTLLLAACSALPSRDGAVTGPFYTPANVTGVARIPAEIRRVIVLPVWGGSQITAETLATLDTVCQAELSRTAKFEVVPLSRQTLANLTGLRQISSVENIPAVLLEKLFSLNNSYGADAVLFIDVTAYSPYTPLTIGLRTKLARSSNSEIIWAADNLFASAEPAVANSARRHAEKLGTDRGRTNLSHTILQNPERFAGYVAAATFATLPPR